MSLYNILVSSFKLNYWNKWTFAWWYSNFSSFTCTRVMLSCLVLHSPCVE